MLQKPIKSERENDAALKRLGELMAADPAEGTAAFDAMMVLSALIRQFEDGHYPFDRPDPLEAIRFRMEQQALKPSDMGVYFGTISRFYEVMNGRRRLTLPMIRKLNGKLGIPADILIRAPKAGPAGAYVYPTEVLQLLQIRDTAEAYPSGKKKQKLRGTPKQPRRQLVKED